MFQQAPVSRILLIIILFLASAARGQTNLQGFITMPGQIVRDFANSINEHNVEKICRLMTDEHKFIDSQGNEITGKEKMREGWIGYFQLFPDYKIEIEKLFVDRDTVAAFGFAGGTYKGLSDKKENYWHLPASWKAVIKEGRIDLWQVYADSKIPNDIIIKNK